MRSKHLIVASVVLFGSLWGLAELGVGELMWARDIPRAPVLTAVGVLFLILCRRLWAVPGSSFALSAVAASFKFLQHPVWGCKVAAVLMVGAVFDIGLSLLEGRSPSLRRRAGDAAVLVAAPLLTFASFILFSYFARDVLHNPYWGMADKMADYMFVQGPVAAALALPAALGGLRLAARLTADAEAWGTLSRFVYRAAAVGSGIAGIAAALALRY